MLLAPINAFSMNNGKELNSGRTRNKMLKTSNQNYESGRKEASEQPSDQYIENMTIFGLLTTMNKNTMTIETTKTPIVPKLRLTNINQQDNISSFPLNAPTGSQATNMPSNKDLFNSGEMMSPLDLNKDQTVRDDNVTSAPQNTPHNQSQGEHTTFIENVYNYSYEVPISISLSVMQPKKPQPTHHNAITALGKNRKRHITRYVLTQLNQLRAENFINSTALEKQTTKLTTKLAAQYLMNHVHIDAKETVMHIHDTTLAYIEMLKDDEKKLESECCIIL